MRILLAAASLTALTLTPAIANDEVNPTPATTEAAAKPETEISTKPAEKPTAPKSEVAAKEPAADKRICRRIRTDASSRRKVKVCMTADQWRDANQAR